MLLFCYSGPLWRSIKSPLGWLPHLPENKQGSAFVICWKTFLKFITSFFFIKYINKENCLLILNHIIIVCTTVWQQWKLFWEYYRRRCFHQSIFTIQSSIWIKYYQEVRTKVQLRCFINQNWSTNHILFNVLVKQNNL